ncbi:Gfo/Idh/MocA family oxidoreductase, partial [Burkholderia cenocepacia]|nr:Gfo/Idh/MocA family oxidoreductase [Burkholderia cenocepacia]
GMVGGGKDAFIGAVHRVAAFMDGKIELVCGAFSVNPEISKQSGEELFVSPDRIYATYEEMIQKEAQLPEGERMDFLTIVTPNFLHFGPAKLALENGFDVVVEKPMTVTLDEAKELERIVESTGRTLCLT